MRSGCVWAPTLFRHGAQHRTYLAIFADCSYVKDKGVDGGDVQRNVENNKRHKGEYYK